MEEIVIAEIVALHEWFDARYGGAGDPDDMERMEAALAPGFTMVTPDGAVLDRAAVMAGVRAGHGRGEPGISIEHPRVLWVEGALACAVYEEWHHTDSGASGRMATALFRSDPQAPLGMLWVHVHETRLPA